MVGEGSARGVVLRQMLTPGVTQGLQIPLQRAFPLFLSLRKHRRGAVVVFIQL
jgi:hypothetical protein